MSLCCGDRSSSIDLEIVLNYEVCYRYLDSESETKPDISNINRLIKVNVYSGKSCNPFTK